MSKKFNKNIIISLITSSSLLIASNIEQVKDFSKYPLSKDATSLSRGGSISDKSASEDGIGTILIGGVGNDSTDINNKSYNQTLKNNKDILSDTTNLKDLNINNSDLNKMNDNKFVKLNNVNGTSCDDNNPLTIGETYLNDKCQGGTLLYPDGQVCNDSNVQTINDKYVNGICIGTNVEGQSCDDGNTQTVNEKYHNGVCTDPKTNGTTCNDGDTNTNTDIWTNSICTGTPIVATCNTYGYSFKGVYISPTLIGGLSDNGQNGAGLFDNHIVNQWSSNNVFYWYRADIDYVTIKMDVPFRIHRYGTSSWSGTKGNLHILKKDTSNNFVNIGTTIGSSNLNETQSELLTNCLEAGTYKFTTVNATRIDSEWTVETYSK